MYIKRLYFQKIVGNRQRKWSSCECEPVKNPKKIPGITCIAREGNRCSQWVLKGPMGPGTFMHFWRWDMGHTNWQKDDERSLDEKNTLCHVLFIYGLYGSRCDLSSLALVESWLWVIQQRATKFIYAHLGDILTLTDFLWWYHCLSLFLLNISHIFFENFHNITDHPRRSFP